MDLEEDTLIKFGTALPEFKEDDVPSRKPIHVEDQIATDENGRRRFHGAFTGGFSAGFWNTVGSLEGWKPQEFKSSRQEKGTFKRQRVEDFMDDEDKGEFGIAHQRVQTKDDYTKQESLSKKPKISSSSGPIPGVPVLQSLLRPAKDNIATRLLKKMGWREGQGIGARQTKGEKKRAKERNQKELYIMEKYGCDLGDRPGPSTAGNEDEGNESDESDSEITFAPDDFDPYLITIKENTFGLGYSGLDRNPVLGKRFNLFQPLEVLDKNNKKLSISGQAFGVGAFEAEDEDIYERDDMTKYDFSLQDQKKKREKKGNLLAIQQGALDGFEAPKSSGQRHMKKVYKVTLPVNFQPRNWTERRSRFDRLPEDRERELIEENSYKRKGLGRHDLTPDQRSALINEPGTSQPVAEMVLPSTSQPPPPLPVKDAPRNKFLELINKKYESFEKSSEIVHETVDLEAKRSLEVARKKTEGLPMVVASSKFKPFPQDLAKQKRYDKFCELPLTKSDEEMKDFLATIQPVELSEWDREMEKKEFIQARKLFRPLDGLMLDRFVSETELQFQAEKDKKEDKSVEEAVVPGQKKTIQMKRVRKMWKPESLLCKRFNVPEPFGGAMVDEKKKKEKPKFSVFDYLEVSVNRKEAFITPTVIPDKGRPVTLEEKKKADGDPQIQKETKGLEWNAIQETSQSNVQERLSTKDLFEKELAMPVAGSTSTATAVPKAKPKERPKSELEEQSIALKNAHPAEKKDLFKAIFESSDSEEEKEERADEGKAAEDVAKKPDVSELLKKSAIEINILRNNSPPRGIFANLFKKPESSAAESEVSKVDPPKVTEKKNKGVESSAPPPKIVFTRKEERTTSTKNDDDQEEEQFFGPKPPPPQRIIETAGTPAKSLFDVLPGRNEDVLDKKLTKALLGKDIKIVEEWIEKDKVKQKKKSKDKKLKKHKKEKKKKKSKDKR